MTRDRFPIRAGSLHPVAVHNLRKLYSAAVLEDLVDVAGQLLQVLDRGSYGRA